MVRCVMSSPLLCRAVSYDTGATTAPHHRCKTAHCIVSCHLVSVGVTQMVRWSSGVIGVVQCDAVVSSSVRSWCYTYVVPSSHQMRWCAYAQRWHWCDLISSHLSCCCAHVSPYLISSSVQCARASHWCSDGVVWCGHLILSVLCHGLVSSALCDAVVSSCLISSVIVSCAVVCHVRSLFSC